MKLLAIALSALLAGCITTPRGAVEAKVIVSVPCITRDQIPAQAFASDASLAPLPDYDLVIALAADRLTLRAWATEAAALLEACVKEPGPDPSTSPAGPPGAGRALRSPGR